MAVTKVKSKSKHKSKSKKFAKNGKNKTMKKNINKTMRGGSSWFKRKVQIPDAKRAAKAAKAADAKKVANQKAIVAEYETQYGPMKPQRLYTTGTPYPAKLSPVVERIFKIFQKKTK